ncbi:periplasmic heavy metal sensor [Tropicimonas sp. IMCC34043]|uniref:periplasmic heavy metal sensor n=1 Tax=Tropicimonas sp. IMCC34043 TaxID=2248760 RepID=UPI000E27793E|nr:periplasmic heavy metal sensor [Tropicimonas sp. IMCC34043]
MTETGSAPVRAPRRGRWLRVLLFVSLALNLAVVGIVGGAILGRAVDGPGPVQVSKELGLGPFLTALDPAQRAALRSASWERRSEMRAGRAAWKQAFDETLQVLRTEPFDAARMQALVDLQADLAANARKVGQEVLIAQLTQMSPEERQAFADRLARDLHFGRGGRSDGKGPRDGSGYRAGGGAGYGHPPPPPPDQ